MPFRVWVCFMNAIVSAALSMIAIGASIYVLSFRERHNLNVPILSNAGKKMIGGVMMFLGLALIVYFVLKIQK